MRRVSRARVPRRFLEALRKYEEEHRIDGSFYLPELGDGRTAGCPVYGHSVMGGRDYLFRVEDEADDSRGPSVDFVDLGEGGLRGQPAYVALRRVIGDDGFDLRDDSEEYSLGYMQGRGAS